MVSSYFLKGENFMSIVPFIAANMIMQNQRRIAAQRDYDRRRKEEEHRRQEALKKKEKP